MNDRDLFIAALQLNAGEERAAYLNDACGTDQERRQRIEKLLQRHEESESFLNPDHVERTAAFELHPSLRSDPPALEATGDQIGPFKLLQKLGDGGMGTVWVAEQEKPVKRRVALKLVKAGMDSAEVLRRFEAERQALAMMDHTNIAKVFDAGTNAQGRPYFVMELIKGVPITKYCDEVHASIRDRLDLFIQVCSAVQHAHQKGIIHRDIKPSNVLVAMQDGKPVPKVIDFGVAKALHSKLADKTMYTEIGQVVGTLEYMAPEQAELSAMDIDTRADIYALGILLYELLTGSTPITRQRIKSAAFAEVLRIIKEEEAPKPSTRLSESKDSMASVASLRRTDPKHLSSELRGELDWVVLKALEKDRTRRYETANGLSRDLQRYLSNEPVEARPPSATYRLQKFVKRNRIQVIAASLVLFALVAGIAGTTLGMWRANAAAEAERRAKLEADEQKEKALRSAERELEERKKAQAKEAEANAVVKFFEDQVFSAARPKGQEGGLGAAVTLRDAITASLPALDKSFTEQPLVEARLRMALGTTYFYLAEHEQAREQRERARALYTRHLGPEHPDTLRSILSLAISYWGLNRQVEALKLNEEVFVIQKRVLPKEHPITLMSMANLALSYSALNRPAEALKLNEETLEIQKRVLPKGHTDTLRIMNNLANNYEVLNHPVEALKLREEVLEIQKRVLPKDHPDTLLSMTCLANSYAALNRPTDALKLQEEVLEIQKRVLPKDHPNTLLSMNNLANSYYVLNRHAEALKLREEVLEIQKRVLPKDHPDTLRSMVNLALSLIQLDRGAEAMPLLDEVIAKAPTSPALNQRGIPFAFSLRMKHFRKVGDLVGCRSTAAMWEKLNRTDAGSLYTAACFRSVTAAVQAKAPGADATRLAQEDADRAMEMLHKAVKAGFKDVALAHNMKKDPDLDFLRNRDDFKKLLADLTTQATPTRSPPDSTKK